MADRPSASKKLKPPFSFLKVWFFKILNESNFWFSELSSERQLRMFIGSAARQAIQQREERSHGIRRVKR
jgi:hypothetical protein